MDSAGDWMDMGGKTAGEGQGLLGVTIGEERLDDWEGLRQWGQFPLGGTLDWDTQTLKCGQGPGRDYRG